MGVEETCFEFGLMLGGHDPQLQGGAAAVIPTSTPPRDRGRVRAAPEQAPRKVLLDPPRLTGLRPRPAEAMLAKAASRPVRVANPEFKRNDNHCVTCLVGQDLAESRFWCPRLPVQGPRAAGPEGRASRGPLVPWRSLSLPLPLAPSLSTFSFLLPVSLCACFLCPRLPAFEIGRAHV